MESDKSTDDTSDITTTESKNAFSIEATYLNRHGQPLASAGVEYRPIDEKSDDGDETGARIVAMFGAHLHF